MAPDKTSLTPVARAALKRSGFARRDFLKQSGALIVSFSLWELGAGLAPGYAQAPRPIAPGSPPPDRLDSWIAIAADGSVTAYTGKVELGQGIVTAQTQLVAEELCVPFGRVKMIYGDTACTPDQLYTSGSLSHGTNFNHSNLAQASATAREMLVRLASDRLGVTTDELVAANGSVRVKSDASRTVSYGELVGGKKFHIALDSKARRRPPSEWVVLGKPVPRPDMPALATGRFEFVHNVRVPGMLHGKVVRPPVVGATVARVDESSVERIPGVVKVVVKNNFVGVVAEKPWQAIQAAKSLNVTWAPGTGLPPQANFYDRLRNQKPTRDTLLLDSKDVDEKFSKAATVLKATYQHPYQMHGSMGSSCAVADVRGDTATLWSATQGAWYMRGGAAMILGLKPENVHVIFTRGSGCYGNNGADTVTYDAALLSQAVARPVRVQLSRKDEMAWESYGNAFVLDERAALDADGNVIAWEHESWMPVLGNRPGATTPGNIITGFLAGFQPDAFAARSPAPEPTRYDNSVNTIPSYVAGVVGGSSNGTGNIASERVSVHNVVSPFWTGPLRSPACLQNTFAHESFIDELAAHSKADPVAFRLRHLTHPRLIDVLNGAAAAANWQVRPSPNHSSGSSRISAGRGIACVAHEGTNSFGSLVAEIQVNQDTGKIVVKRVVVCVDCGPVSNPDGLRNQIEGGALQGISRAMVEEVTWDDQKVTSFDWATYHSLPLGFAIPEVEVKVINRPDAEATGAGELSITLMAAALANAIFDATGTRVRQIPFTSESVRTAILKHA